MTENKTKATQASVGRYIGSLPENRRSDAKTLVKLMESVTRQKPKLWGTSIIGFGVTTIDMTAVAKEICRSYVFRRVNPRTSSTT